MDQDTRWFESPLAVVDVETTGLDPETDRVIEVAVIHMCRGEVTDRWSTLVNPEQDVPDEVVKITGIDPTALVDAPRFAAVADEVRARISDRVFVAYNLAFDRAFVAGELRRAGLTWPDVVAIDPLIFARELHKSEGSKRLGAVAERLEIPLENAHRAEDDAVVAGLVLYAFAAQLPAHLDELRMLQEQWELQQKNEMMGWRSRSGRFDDVSGDATTLDRGNALGPAYLYGDDTDPIRAMFRHLPDSGGARR